MAALAAGSWDTCVGSRREREAREVGSVLRDTILSRPVDFYSSREVIQDFEVSQLGVTPGEDGLEKRPAFSSSGRHILVHGSRKRLRQP